MNMCTPQQFCADHAAVFVKVVDITADDRGPKVCWGDWGGRGAGHKGLVVVVVVRVVGWVCGGGCCGRQPCCSRQPPRCSAAARRTHAPPLLMPASRRLGAGRPAGAWQTCRPFGADCGGGCVCAADWLLHQARQPERWHRPGPRQQQVPPARRRRRRRRPGTSQPTSSRAWGPHTLHTPPQDGRRR
jgi:hypothetical protein